jgi:hypothetical protein
VCSSNILDNIGCIEVLVLRCAGSRNAKTALAMSLDGANDSPSQPFGMDGQPRGPNESSMYDDRSPYFGDHGNTHRPPPPFTSYCSPYAETVHTRSPTVRSRRSSLLTRNSAPFAASSHQHPHSRYSEAISPGAKRINTIPSDAIQYGSGPIPTGPMLGSERSFYHTRPASAVVANAPGVDPAWLNEILTKAVKRGVEESRRTELSSQVHTQPQPPGAWPQSPFSPGVQPVQPSDFLQQDRVNPEEDGGTTWGESQAGWRNDQGREKAKPHVNWTAGPECTKPDKWDTPEETQSDTWDTEETWKTNKSDGKEASRWDISGASTIRTKLGTRAVSPAMTRTHRLEHHQSHRTRSKSRRRSPKWEKRQRPTSEDHDGWTHVKDTSSSLASWEASDDSLQSPRSQDHRQASKKRSRSRRRSHHAQSAHSNDRRSLQHLRGGADRYSTSARSRYVPSTSSEAVPTVMNAPAFMHPPAYPSQVPLWAGNYSEAGLPIATSPPPWDPVAPEILRNHSSDTTCMPPAPFSGTGKNFKYSSKHRSASSSSWDAAKKDTSKEHRERLSSRSAGWGKEGKTDETNNSWDSENKKKSSWNVADNAGWGTGNNGSDAKDAWGATKGEANGWTLSGFGWDDKNTSKSEEVAAKESNGWPADTDNRNGTRAPDVPWDTQDNAWNNDNETHDSNEVQWNNDTPWPSAPVPAPTDPKPASTSKRHTSKSLSKYRSRRPTTNTAPKPHWQFPPPLSSTKTLPTISKLPAEPLLKLTPSQASSKSIEHQVRAGVGTQYGHAISRPEYIDSLEKPYAVFRFKYRSRAILKDMFGDEVPDRGHLSTRTYASKTVKDREKLKDVSKEVLIDKMLRLQMKLEERNGKGGGRRGESVNPERVARDATADWVRMHSREASEKGTGGGKEKGGETWGQSGVW